MNRFVVFQNQVLTYDMINKFNYINVFQIPKIQKIHLNFNFSKQTITKPKIQLALSVLELISGQLSIPCKSSKNKIHLKIKKKDIVGCKVTLSSPKSFIFLDKLILFIFPYLKDFRGLQISKKQFKSLSFSIPNTNLFQLPELNSEFLRFKDLPNLDVTITSNITSYKLTQTLFSGYQIPINFLRK